MFWIFLKFRDSKLHSINQNNKFCIWYLNLQMSSPIFRQYYNIFVFSVYFTITDYHSQNIFYFQNKRSAIILEDCQTNQFHLGQSRYWSLSRWKLWRWPPGSAHGFFHHHHHASLTSSFLSAAVDNYPIIVVGCRTFRQSDWR